MENQVIDHEIASIWLADNGVRYFVYKQDISESVEQAREICQLMIDSTDGVSMPTLVDLRKVKAISRESRVFWASPMAAKAMSRSALMVKSGISRVIGNFFLGLSKPHMPVRLFESDEEAIAWLKEEVN